VASGPFIVDLDNPYALTGYNLWAMKLYRPVLRAVLASRRCVGIRCMSEACRQTLHQLFGTKVSGKAEVHYPASGMRVVPAPAGPVENPCRFLFVSTQFEIKGGVALLRAFRKLLETAPDARLDLVTHLPSEHESLVQACNGAVTVHHARFSRQQIFDRFISHADVLIHPTYVDSFGMVALEALAAGLGLIVTDVYALPELVRQDWNGFVLPAPISIWNGYLPSADYYHLGSIKQRIRDTDTSDFEVQLENALRTFATDTLFRVQARQNSSQFFREKFLVGAG
jgi:glycosyltransferase involved in cell wall biosynthesis